MSLDAFKSQIKTKGLARLNRYEVILPPTLTSSSDDMQMASVFCDAVQLPGLNIATTQQRIYGEQRELPYERMVDPLNLSFYVDTDMRVKMMFDSWINKVINPNSKVTSYYNDYVQDITIKVVSVDDLTKPYSVTLREAYPKSVSPIQMDATSRDVMKLNVTLMYKYFIINELNGAEGQSAVQNTPAAISIAKQDPLNVTTGTGYTPTVSQMFKDVTSQ